MGVIVQLISSALICCSCACMGIMYAWPSSTLRLFESSNTTLHRPMTEGEIALFGSLSSVGALIGTPIMGMILDKLGRKNSSILASSLGMLAWLLVAVSNRVEVVLLAMFISGLNGAALLVVPVYLSEICQESIRGAMASGSIVFYCIGMLLSYLMGGLLSYYSMIYVSLTLTACVASSLLFLRESPTQLMLMGLEEEAGKSLAFYRQEEANSKIVQEQLNVIRRSLNHELDEITPEEEKLNSSEPGQKKEKLSLFKFIKKSRSTRKAFILSMTLVTLAIFQGLVVVQVYAEPLFEEAIPTMSPTVGSIILAVVTVLVGFVAAYLTEAAGRRPLMIYSAFAAGASCLCLGLQLHLKWGPNWLIAVNLYLFTSFYSLGAGTVPFVLLSEVFLPEVKSVVTMVVIEWTWFCNSVILFIFNPVLKAIGLGPVFYFFAAVGIITGVYSILMLPETKGLTVDKIQEKLVKNKKKDIY